MPRPAIGDEKPFSLRLSQRDSLLVMDLLANPPTANAKLLKAARSLSIKNTLPASSAPSTPSRRGR